MWGYFEQTNAANITDWTKDGTIIAFKDLGVSSFNGDFNLKEYNLTNI